MNNGVCCNGTSLAEHLLKEETDSLLSFLSCSALGCPVAVRFWERGLPFRESPAGVSRWLLLQLQQGALKKLLSTKRTSSDYRSISASSLPLSLSLHLPPAIYCSLFNIKYLFLNLYYSCCYWGWSLIESSKTTSDINSAGTPPCQWYPGRTSYWIILEKGMLFRNQLLMKMMFSNPYNF